MMHAMATDPAFGTRIRTRRQEMHLTQAELAARVGVDPSSVISWEKGRHFPKRWQGALEKVLGISLERDEGLRVISPELRRLVLSTLDDPEDQRRVIGLLEGTLTWPGEPGRAGARGKESAAG